MNRQKPQKVVLAYLEQHDRYKVVQLVNRIEPVVGHILKKSEVQNLIGTPGLNVEIKPERK